MHFCQYRPFSTTYSTLYPNHTTHPYFDPRSRKLQHAINVHTSRTFPLLRLLIPKTRAQNTRTKPSSRNRSSPRKPSPTTLRSRPLLAISSSFCSSSSVQSALGSISTEGAKSAQGDGGVVREKVMKRLKWAERNCGPGG
jgi:hypothetical protein